MDITYIYQTEIAKRVGTLNKNLSRKKIFSILLGVVIVFATFYFVYENLNKSKAFTVCVCPENTNFSQGTNLPISIMANPNTNNFQSYFPGSESCINPHSAYIQMEYLANNPNSCPGLFNGEGSTLINDSCYYISDTGTIPFSIYSSQHSDTINWNGTIHIYNNDFTGNMFEEANAGYYHVYLFMTIKSTDFGKTSQVNDIVSFKNTVVTLSGLFVNYAIENGNLSFNFNQFNSSCTFNSGSLTIISTNGSKFIENNLAFPGVLSLNEIYLEHQLSQKSIYGDTAIIHNRYGDIWIALD